MPELHMDYIFDFLTILTTSHIVVQDLEEIVWCYDAILDFGLVSFSLFLRSCLIDLCLNTVVYFFFLEFLSPSIFQCFS